MTLTEGITVASVAINAIGGVALFIVGRGKRVAETALANVGVNAAKVDAAMSASERAMELAESSVERTETMGKRLDECETDRRDLRNKLASHDNQIVELKRQLARHGGSD